MVGSFRQDRGLGSSGVSPDELVSAAGIAEMLSVTPMTAHRYARRADFPEPFGHAGGGRVWLRVDVEKWATKTLPLRAGRPRKENADG